MKRALLVLALTAACTATEPTPSPLSIVGTYRLVSVSDAPLPHAVQFYPSVQHPQTAGSLESGFVIFNADSSFVEVESIRSGITVYTQVPMAGRWGEEEAPAGSYTIRPPLWSVGYLAKLDRDGVTINNRRYQRVP